jgi:hypothetical protein
MKIFSNRIKNSQIKKWKERKNSKLNEKFQILKTKKKVNLKSLKNA